MAEPRISEIKYLGGGTEDFLEVRVPADYPDPENLRLVIYDRNHNGSATAVPAPSDIYVVTDGNFYPEDANGFVYYTFGTSEDGTTIFLHAQDAAGLYNVVTEETYGLLSWGDSTYTVSDASGDPYAGIEATQLDNTGQVRDETSLELQPDGSYALNLTPGAGESIPCFTAGTLILTAQGVRKVETLAVGDLIVTKDNAIQPIRWIGWRTLSKKDLTSDPKKYPVRILAGALGLNYPEKDLLVSRQHRVLIRSKIAERMFGKDEVLVPAFRLTELPGIYVDENVENIEYIHFLFDNHEIVYSNGAPTESLFTGPEALKALRPEAREEILSLFPELENLHYSPEPARLLLTGKQQRRLIDRHKKNNQRLI